MKYIIRDHYVKKFYEKKKTRSGRSTCTLHNEWRRFVETEYIHVLNEIIATHISATAWVVVKTYYDESKTTSFVSTMSKKEKRMEKIHEPKIRRVELRRRKTNKNECSLRMYAVDVYKYHHVSNLFILFITFLFCILTKKIKKLKK